MTPHTILATIFVYLILLFYIAWRTSKRVDNGGFFIGNKATRWYMAAFAMIGSAMSGVTFVSVPGSVATDSFSYMQMVVGFTVGQLIVAFVLVPIFYRTKLYSLYQYLDNRFGEISHRSGAWFFFGSKVLRSSLSIYVVCAVMQALLFDHYGVPFGANIAMTIFVVWLYTFRGGVKSLIWTDSLQTLCLVAALVVAIVSITKSLGYNFGELAQFVATSPQSRIWFFDDPSSSRYFWKMLFGGIFALVAMTGLDQDMMQRNLSCRTKREAQINIVTTAIFQAIVIMMFLTLGTLLYKYSETMSIAMPAKSDQLFGMIATNNGLPLIVGLLFVVGLISTTYSAAGSALTSLTTSFTVDILGGVDKYSEEKLTALRKWIHGAIAVLMSIVIYCFEIFGNDSVINLVYKVASYTYGPLLGLFMFGFFTKLKLRDRWVPLVMVASVVASGALQTIASTTYNYNIGFELIAYNALFTIFGLFIISKR